MTVPERGNQVAPEGAPHSRMFPMALGVVLLALGIAAVVWIAGVLFSLAGGPRNMPFVAAFLSFDRAGRSLVTPGGPIELPEGAFFAVGIILQVAVIWVVGGLARVLISSGAHLIEPEGGSVARRLVNELKRIRGN
jgi:hypothetical protein